MYKNILLPVDGSELSQRAVEECISLAQSSGAKVTAFHVVSHFHLSPPWGASRAIHQKIEKAHEDEALLAAREMEERLVQRIKAEGIDCEGLVVVGDHPYEEIIRQAEARKCDLIVMASHGRRGLNAVLIGSETVKVLTHSKTPVLVVR